MQHGCAWAKRWFVFGRREQGCRRFHWALQNRHRWTTELFISGIFHVVFSDCGWPLTTSCRKQTPDYWDWEGKGGLSVLSVRGILFQSHSACAVGVWQDAQSQAYPSTSKNEKLSNIQKNGILLRNYHGVSPATWSLSTFDYIWLSTSPTIHLCINSSIRLINNGIPKDFLPERLRPKWGSGRG